MYFIKKKEDHTYEIGDKLRCVCVCLCACGETERKTEESGLMEETENFSNVLKIPNLMFS